MRDAVACWQRRAGRIADGEWPIVWTQRCNQLGSPRPTYSNVFPTTADLRRAAPDSYAYRFEYADGDDASDQGLSVAWAVSTWSGVAAQLARRFSACSDFDPVSAVKANIVSPGSPESSIVS